jgi:hypothetical protein
LAGAIERFALPRNAVAEDSDLLSEFVAVGDVRFARPKIAGIAIRNQPAVMLTRKANPGLRSESSPGTGSRVLRGGPFPANDNRRPFERRLVTGPSCLGPGVLPPGTRHPVESARVSPEEQ